MMMIVGSIRILETNMNATALINVMSMLELQLQFRLPFLLYLDYQSSVYYYRTCQHSFTSAIFKQNLYRTIIL